MKGRGWGRGYVRGGVYFGGGNPSIVLNFFICINSVRTPRPCGLKLSLTLSFLVRAKGGGGSRGLGGGCG